MRIGIGYDVHKLVEGRPLVLGGVTVPYEKGLLGHSDADVLTHAIMDSLLGAAGLGDIGVLFPDTDERFAGIDSCLLLKEVGDRLWKEGWCVGNIDAVVVAQAPKLRPYIGAMQEKIAETLGISKTQVSIKATTEEGLGFTGTGQGMAAKAVSLIESLYEGSTPVNAGCDGCPRKAEQ